MDKRRLLEAVYIKVNNPTLYVNIIMDPNATDDLALFGNSTPVLATFTSVNTSTDGESGHGVYISKTVLKVIFAIISILGIVGNLMVILVITRVKLLRTLTNYFILNQSCVDLVGSILLAALNCFPDIVVPDTPGGVVLCKFWVSSFPLWGCFNSSTLNLVFLTIERYMGVVHPVLHHNKFTKTKAKILVGIVWIVPYLWLSYWAGVNKPFHGACYPFWPNITAQKAIGVMAFLVSYLIPLSMMTFTYIRMLMVLRNQAKLHVTNQPSITAPNYDKTRRAKRNVIKTLLLVFISYIICWSPNQIEYFRYNMGALIDLNSVWFQVTIIMAFCNVCINPVVYSLKYQQFRDGLKKLICKSGQQHGQVVCPPPSPPSPSVVVAV
ncbi:allatostatin-A receptor-like [Glandiceps talaboti]